MRTPTKVRIHGAMAFAIASMMMVLTAASTAPASAATPASPKTDVAQAIITKTTGSVATDVASVAGQRRLRQQLPHATRDLAVLTAGQSSATFTGLIPAGSKITPNGKDFSVLTPVGVKMTIGAPWAVDAAGKRLVTSYTFTGNTITQKVDTTGATFPVVADPLIQAIWSGVGFFLTRTEIFRAYYSGRLNYLTMGTAACNMMSATGKIPSCTLYPTSDKITIGTLVYQAAHSYSGSATGCLTVDWYYKSIRGIYGYGTPSYWDGFTFRCSLVSGLL